MSDDESGILMARERCSPKLLFRMSERPDSEEAFEYAKTRAMFDIADMIIDVDEGQLYTTEPPVITVEVYVEDREVDFLEIKHFVTAMESKYDVFRVDVSGSTERDPDALGIQDPFEGAEFKEEPTEVERR